MAKKPVTAKAVHVPRKLAVAIRKNAKARTYFDSLPPSHKRAYIEYVTEAKKPETRDRRIAHTVATLAVSHQKR